MIKKIDESTYQLFQSTYADSDFFLSVEYGNRLVCNGYKVDYLGYYHNEQLKACCIFSRQTLMRLFEKGNIASGMLIDYKDRQLVIDFSNELKQFIKKNYKKVVYFEIDPKIDLYQHDKDGNIVEDGINNEPIVETLKQAGYHQVALKKGYDLSRQSRWNSAIYLNGKSQQQVFDEFSPKARQSVNTALKWGTQVRELSYQELNIFTDMEKLSSERQNYNPYPLEYYQGYYNHFKDYIKAMYAYIPVEVFKGVVEKEIEKTQPKVEKKHHSIEDETYLSLLNEKMDMVNQMIVNGEKELPLAAGIFILYRDRLSYVFGASNYQFRTLQGPYAVQWTMIKMAIENKCSIYDMLGISGYFKKGEQGYGVFDYKRGFGAVVREYIGFYLMPIKPLLYKFYSKLKKIEE